MDNTGSLITVFEEYNLKFIALILLLLFIVYNSDFDFKFYTLIFKNFSLVFYFVIFDFLSDIFIPTYYRLRSEM